MIRIISLLSLLLNFEAVALSSLQVGDILLQPLSCWACSLIEAEEETIFSHMGIVMQESPVVIAEAYGTVRALPLAEFLAKTERGQKVAVLRLRNEKAQRFLEGNKEKFQDVYTRYFDGKKYDTEFLWNNFDEEGREKLYCSELVSKLLQAFMRLETPIKRMHFNKNRDLWIKYFKGNPPDGKWGNSPADFERSDLFYFAGEL
jgi:hypothetical protein